MDYLDEHLAMVAVSHKYNPAIKATVTIEKKMLNLYYNQSDHSDLFRITMGMWLEGECLAHKVFVNKGELWE